MPRLPTPGSDENTWGAILNDFLAQSLNSDGTVKSTAIQAAQPDATSTTKGVLKLTNDLGGTASLPQVTGLRGRPISTTTPASNNVLAYNSTSNQWEPQAGAGAPDATTSSKGVVQLAGDLGGTAAAPTVPGKQPLDSNLTAIAGLSPSNDDIIQRKSGAWTNRTPAQLKTDLVLTKSDVGLGNVDDTSDVNKPVSTATQTALNAKEDTITAGTTAQYWRGDKSWQTLNATAVGLGNVPNLDATARANHTGTQTAATISDFDTQVRTSRLDQMAAPTAAVGMNSQLISGLADPALAQDAATKAYVDATAQGLDVKQSVRAATTTNITLSGAQIIDGVSVVSGDRVLVKDQGTGSQNGIYVAAVGVWARSSDANSSTEVTGGLFTFVMEGTTNGNYGFVLTTDDPITLDTTVLTFTQFSGAGQVTTGAGLTKTGNTLDVGQGTGLTVNADDVAVDFTAVQAKDSTLDALAAHNTNGLVTQTAADTFTGRTIMGTSNRITVTNGNGVSDNPTLDIGSDVATLTGSQTLTNKTITDSSNNVTANSLRNATGTVSVSAATAPSTGQTLRAANATTATWQDLSAANVSFAAGGTFTATDVQGAIAEAASDATAALAAHTGDTAAHGGIELAIAQKTDGNFVTNANLAPVDIPGLSITITVPNRPYVVRLMLNATIEELGAESIVYITADSQILQQCSHRAVTAGSFDTYFLEYRVPSAFHAPTTGSTVTYKLQVRSSASTSDITIYAADLGVFGQWIASITAITQ